MKRPGTVDEIAREIVRDDDLLEQPDEKYGQSDRNIFRLHAAAKDIAEFGNGIPGPGWVFVYQRPDTVQRIKNEMRIHL